MDSSEKSGKSTGSRRSSLMSAASANSLGSLFGAARKSFTRSSGQRGASVEVLRGNTGADFEGKGKVFRRHGVTGCSCVFGGKSGDKKDKHILIKGPFCFVFVNETATAPKYAISLNHLKPQRSGKTVYLETNLGDVSYEVVLHEEEDAKKFSKAVREQASVAENEEIKKKLGHGHLLKKHASVRYAETVALKKIGEQPSEPLGIDEIAINSPVSPGF